MKTDYDKFMKLYKSVGVEPELGTEDWYNGGYISSGEISGLSNEEIPNVIRTKILTLASGDNMIGGYSGFSTDLVFNEAGKFIKQNFWE